MTRRTATLRRIVCSIAAVIVCCVCNLTAYGQAGLRESLERLDRNQDGEIDPHEITPLSRPYLERIARVRRMRLDRSNDIDDLQEAARLYYARQNGLFDREVRPSRQGSIKPFGPERDQPLVPEFGLGEMRYPYTQEDVWFADRTMRSHDRNRDGYRHTDTCWST